MNNVYMDDYCRLMDSLKLNHTKTAENIVRVPYKASNAEGLSVYIIFDKAGGNTVEYRVHTHESFAGAGRLSRGLILCNSLNALYRWSRFYLDETRELLAEFDVPLPENDAGKVCKKYCDVLARNVDVVYPEIRKALGK